MPWLCVTCLKGCVNHRPALGREEPRLRVTGRSRACREGEGRWGAGPAVPRGKYHTMVAPSFSRSLRKGWERRGRLILTDLLSPDRFSGANRVCTHPSKTAMGGAAQVCLLPREKVGQPPSPSQSLAHRISTATHSPAASRSR